MKMQVIVAIFIITALFFSAGQFTVYSEELNTAMSDNKISSAKPDFLGDEPVTFTNVSPQAGFSGLGAFTFSWGDYNNDGYEDVLFSNKLFRNNGPPNWNFTDVSVVAGINTSPGPGVWGDYDNDGDLDIYAVAGWPTWDVLWRNNGNGTFTNVTVAAGSIYDRHPSCAAAWGDYDNDGDIDLYVANYETSTAVGTPDMLWRNNGVGTFVDISTYAGIRARGNKCGRGVTWADFDNDGDLDIYVSNYRLNPNFLWQNDGNGKFTDVGEQFGVAGIGQDVNGNIPGPYYGHTIGAAWGDFNNDGNLDLFAANLAHKDVGSGTYNRGLYCDDSALYRNNGPALGYNFTDIRASSGIPVHPPGSTHPSGYFYDELFSGIAWGDFDNDGDLDLWIPQVYGNLEFGHSFLYRQDGIGSGHFTDVSTQVGDGTTCTEVRVWGGYAGAWCDYNNDGFLDLITSGIYPYNGKNEIRLFKNNGNTNHWLKIKLVGRDCNRAAIGARVKVIAGNLTQIREVEGGTSSHSHQNSLILHFGLGDYSGTVCVEVRWPCGKRQKLMGVQTNQLLQLDEGNIVANSTISLQKGWNFVSIPLNPISNSIETVFSEISNNYDLIKYYDAFADADNNWKIYSPRGPSYLNTLRNINNTMAIWLHVTTPVTFTLWGYATTTTTIQLKAGWNMVGYPSNTERTVGQLFADAPAGLIMQTYSVAEKYNLRPMALTDYMKPGYGYWVYLPKDWQWRVPW